MHTLVKKLIKLHILPDFSKLPQIDSETYQVKKRNIEGLGWDISNRQSFKRYESDILNIMNFQNSIRSNDLLLETISNYLELKMKFIANNSNDRYHVTTIILWSCISINQSILELANSPANTYDKGIYKARKKQALLNRLNALINYLFKFEMVQSQHNLQAIFPELSSEISMIEQTLSRKVIEDIWEKEFYDNYSNTNILEYDKFLFFDKVYRKGTKNFKLHVLQKYILNSYKYRILEEYYKANDLDLADLVEQDLKFLEEKKEVKMKKSYSYLKAKFLGLKTNYSNLLLTNKQKTTNSQKLIRQLTALYKNLAQNEKEEIHEEILFYKMIYHFQMIRELCVGYPKNSWQIQKYINKIRVNSEWYNNESFLNKSESNLSTKYIVDLILMFTNTTIKKTDFEFLYNIKDIALKHELLLKLFNLTFGKFCLRSIGINIPYKENHYIEHLLNNKFMEIVLKQDINSDFISNIEINRMRKQENELIQLIKKGETIDSEFKSTFFVDLKKTLMKNNSEISRVEKNYGNFLETIVSFLNSGGGRLIVGVWEVDKIPNDCNSKYANYILVDKSLGEDYCLTGLGFDLDILRTTDSLALRLEEVIKNFITPEPLTRGDKIVFQFEKILDMKICVINVPQGKSYYYLWDLKKEKKNFIIRTNAGKKTLTIDEAITYVQSNPRSPASL